VDRTEIVLNNKTIKKNEEGSLEFVFCTIERQNSNQYTKGDKIICRDETFYLLSNTDNEIKMISEKNINVTGSGEVKQMDNAGSITFNCVNNQVNYYWKDESGNYKDEYEVETHFGNVFRYVYDRNSNIYPYLNDYKDYLKKTIDLDVIDISIMSLTQIVDFLDITDASQSISGPEWLFAEESWLGSVYGSSDEQYTSTGIRPDDSWNIIGGINAAPSQFYCSSNNTSKSGVRPLVTISTNYIN